MRTSKFALQTYLNELAPNFSKSVLTKIRVYLNSILDEAVELAFIIKNPSAKLAVPRSGKKVTGVRLTPEQIPVVLFNLSDRDRLIVHMFLMLGLRPGTLFALCWNDLAQNSLRIDCSLTELGWWRSPARTLRQTPSTRGTATNTNNFLFRVSRKQARRPESLASRIRCSGARA